MTKALYSNILVAVLVISGSLSFAPYLSADEFVQHKIIFQVNDNDPARMNLVLNNVANVNKFYLDKGEVAQIEVVAYGPGLKMLIDGMSPVKDRIKSISQNFDNVAFKACKNTYKAMTRKVGKDLHLLPQAKLVDAGVIHLVKRQEQGWSYLRP
jgi:intracellular sulfur oxidation DsrE/DsrF family protein